MFKYSFEDLITMPLTDELKVEIVEYVTDALIKQGYASMIRGACAYRANPVTMKASDGACGVGHLMSDLFVEEFGIKEDNTVSIAGIVFGKFPSHNEEMLNFLSKLQTVHDHWIGNPQVLRREMVKLLST